MQTTKQLIKFAEQVDCRLCRFVSPAKRWAKKLLVKNIQKQNQHCVCRKAGWTLEQWASYRYQHRMSGDKIAEILFPYLCFYIFIQQRFQAVRSMDSDPVISPVRCLLYYQTTLKVVV